LGEFEMKRKLMDILACPIDKYYPLDLHVFEEKDEIVEGVIICPKDEIPFLKKWKDKIPEKILVEGKPFNLK
jgi:uncharacterized protein YbaR (Trm112 family)